MTILLEALGVWPAGAIVLSPLFVWTVCAPQAGVLAQVGADARLFFTVRAQALCFNWFRNFEWLLCAARQLILAVFVAVCPT